MAVSYLSTSFKPSPYVLPLDLGLFERVMTIKQKKFDLGVAHTQAQIDELGKLDVLKDEDRQYLNGKIKNIVDSVNGLGGVDYSDMNTLNQIDALSRDVYGDEGVISALAGTQSVRNLVKTYNEFKSNPKLKGQYSEVNEAYDMQRVNQWLSDGQQGSKYQGPSAATPYRDYKTSLMKNLDKVRADLFQNIDDKGLFYVNEVGERITPSRIVQMAHDLLTPDEAAQMKRDSWYLYNVQSPIGPDGMITKAMEQYNHGLTDQKRVWDEYEALAKAAASDPEAKMRYDALAVEARKTYETLKAQEQNFAQSAIQRLQADPEGFGFELYKNDFFRGLGNRYSVNRTERKIVADQAEMFERRLDQQERFHKDEVDYRNQMLELKAQENALDFYGKVYKSVDPVTGKVSFLPVPGGGLTPTNVNTQDPAGLRVTVDNLQQRNASVLQEADRAELKFLDNMAVQYPELFQNQQTTEGTGIVRVLRNQKLFEGFNQQKGFQIEDLGAVNQAGVQKQLVQAGWTPEQISYLQTLHRNVELMTQGKADMTPDLPQGAAAIIEKRRLARLYVDSNNEKVRLVTQQALADAGLSQGEQDLYADFLLNPSKYGFDAPSDAQLSGDAAMGSATIDFGFGKSAKLDPRIKALMKKRPFQDVTRRVNDYLATLGTRDVYGTRTISDKESKALGMPAFAAAEIKRLFQADVAVDKVTPLTAGMNADGSNTFYMDVQYQEGSGSDATTRTVRVPLSDANAQKMGFVRDPYAPLNEVVTIRGASGEIPVYGGNKNLAVSINIVKNDSNNLNDDSAFAQVVYQQLDEQGRPTGKVTRIKLPASDGRTPSEAYALAKQAVEKASKAGISYEEFKQYLVNYKNQ